VCRETMMNAKKFCEQIEKYLAMENKSIQEIPLPITSAPLFDDVRMCLPFFRPDIKDMENGQDYKISDSPTRSSTKLPQRHTGIMMRTDEKMGPFVDGTSVYCWAFFDKGVLNWIKFLTDASPTSPQFFTSIFIPYDPIHQVLLVPFNTPPFLVDLGHLLKPV